MNSTSFICVNNSKICDLYGAIFYTNILGNTAFKRANKPLWRAKQSLWRSQQSLRRSNQSLRRSNQSLRRSNQSLRRSKQLKPDEADVIHHLGSIKCNLVNLKLHVHSSCTYRFSVRKLTKQSNSTRYRRDREPSRLPLKKIILAMRKRKNRTFLKHSMLRSAPKSSILNKIGSNYKQCCFQFVHMQHISHLGILNHVLI